VGGYFVVLQSNRTIAAATLVDELGTGSQVVYRLLAMRHERFQQSVQVLVRDFALARHSPAANYRQSAPCLIITASALMSRLSF
jgi:hypothetical protein